MTPEHLANLLGAAALAVDDRLRGTLADALGLEGEAAAAIVTVGTRPGRPIKHLSESLSLTHSGTVRMVDRLEKRGWVERRPEAGGRTVRLWLTPRGEQVFEDALEARRALLRRLLEPLSERQRAGLHDALSELLGEVATRRSEAWTACRLCDHRVCRGDDCPVGASIDVAEISG